MHTSPLQLSGEYILVFLRKVLMAEASSTSDQVTSIQFPHYARHAYVVL